VAKPTLGETNVRRDFWESEGRVETPRNLPESASEPHIEIRLGTGSSNEMMKGLSGNRHELFLGCVAKVSSLQWGS
jgi:hypothetical protein